MPNDPNEQKNLASNSMYKQNLEHMRKLLDQHMKQTGDPFLGKPFTQDYNSRNYEMPEKEGET